MNKKRLIFFALSVVLVSSPGIYAQSTRTFASRLPQILVPSIDIIWIRLGDAEGAVDEERGDASIESAEFSPDGTLIASAAKMDNSVRLWRVEDGSEVWNKYTEDEVEVVTFTRDGKFLVTGGEDHRVRIWRVENGEVVHTFDHIASIEGMRFSHSGSMLATGDEAGQINIWDTSDPDPTLWPARPRYTLMQGSDQDRPGGGIGHSDVNSIDWTVDDRFIVTAGRNTVVKRWEIAHLGDADQGLRQTYSGFHDSIKSTRLSSDGKFVAAGGQNSPDGLVLVWDYETGELVKRIDYPNSPKIETVEWTTDGRYLFTGGIEGKEGEQGYPGNGGIGAIRVYDAQYEFVSVLEQPVFRQEYLDFSEDGNFLVSSHEDGTVRLWGYTLVEHPLLERMAPHPRLLLTPERERHLQALAGTDPLLQEILDVIRQYAELALEEPVVSYTFDEPNNPPATLRLKEQRRASMFRVLNLALTYRLTGDERYAERAKADLLAAALFPDWWPPHFLNVGEFSAVVALGYDWLYDYLTETERSTIAEGLLRNGIDAGLQAYSGAEYGWWRNDGNNWNQVCNAGLVLAALAVADKDPYRAQAVIDHAITSIPRAMRSYLPDGAWEEGPTYWAYGTTYNALLLDALGTAVDTLYGLDHVAGYPELGRSGAFHIQTVGPTNLYFNFGDAKEIAYFSPVLFWMSRHFEQPVYAWYERELVRKDLPRMRSGDLMKDDTLDRFLALLAVWYNEDGQQRSYDDLPFDMHFEGSAAVGAMRSGWTEDALYLGFKGGDNQADHGHMDIGSFVLDAEGVRWALDLGGDDYGLPGYFDFSGPRWQYFRLNNRGHNTLVLADDVQTPHAQAEIVDFISDQHRAYAIIDMSGAYSNHARRVRRGFALLDRSRVLIQDEIMPLYSGFDIRWGMVTSAQIEIDGASAVLKQNDEILKAEILEPGDAVFQVEPAYPGDDRQANNAGMSLLTVHLTADWKKQTNFTVLLTPVNEETTGLPAPEFRPLNPTATPVDQGRELPTSLVLHGNYPNPFNPATSIRFDLPVSAEVIIEIIDLMGRSVLTLPAQQRPGGINQTIWLDASTLSSGTYVYRVTARSAIKTWIESGRLVLLK